MNSRRTRPLLVAAAALILAAPLAVQALAGQPIATLRGGAALDENPKAPAIPGMVDSDLRQVRNYPEQPPLIPHKIDGYQIDLNANKCLGCHARDKIGESQAPMVSITHFMNREGQFLAAVTPRRYFCNQCHVAQSEARPLVGNVFLDVDKVLEGAGDN